MLKISAWVRELIILKYNSYKNIKEDSAGIDS